MSVLTTRNELLTASGLDWLHIVDVSDPTDSPQGTSKKIKLDNIFANYLGFDTRYYTKTEINNFLGGFTSISGYNKNDWDDAFGWGDHSTAGYLESLQDGQGTIVDNSDPVNPKVNWGGFMDEGMELEIDAADDNEIGIYWYLYDNPGAEVEFGFHPTNINLSWNAEGSDHDLIIGGNRTILRAYVPDTDLGHYRDDLIEIGGQASGKGVLLESQDHDTNEKSSFKIRPFGMFMETPAVYANTATNGQVLKLTDAATGQIEFQNESIASAGQGLTNDSGVLNLGGTIDEEVIIDMKAQGLGASFSIQDTDQESNQIYFDHNEISIRNDTAVHINAHEINEGLVDIRAGVVNIKTGAKTSNGLLKLMTPDVFDNDAVAGQVLTLIDEETGEVDFRDTAATFDGTFDGNISFERPTTPTVGGYDVTMDEGSIFMRTTSANNSNASHIQITPTRINLNGETTIYNPLTVYAASEIYGGLNVFGTITGDGSGLTNVQLTSEKGAANGYAPLNGSGIIDTSYLPSYVDDVLEYADFASFPVTGEAGKIYIDLSENDLYRWSGSVYVEVAGTAPATWGSITGTLSSQTDLQTALNGKAGLADQNNFTNWMSITGNPSPLRLFGTGTGTSNAVYLSLYESNGITRQGYVGFPSSTNNDLVLRNDTTTQNLTLVGTGGTSALKFFDGSSVQTIWHSGNSFTKSGTDIIFPSSITVTSTSDGEALLTFDTDRSWRFQQGGNDASTSLDLFELSTGTKVFKIGNITSGGVISMHSGSGDIDSIGDVTANDFIQSSDERLKSNIQPLEIKPIKADWKSFEMKDRNRVGVIAQELEKNHPEFVHTNEEGYKSVSYIDLLVAKIHELENRIKQLEG